MSNLNATVVLRCAGENTKSLALKLLCQEYPQENIFPIEVSPFSLAVKKTFEIGVAEARKWTLAIDADVLVKHGAINELLNLAENADDNLFELEGNIWDKLFGGPRSGGIHLYRTSLLDEALSNLDTNAKVNRPEYTVIAAMRDQGYLQSRFEIIVGLHDFFQKREDYFRKGVSISRKFQHFHWFFEPMWERLKDGDKDIEEALTGWIWGTKNPGLAITDSQEYNEILQKRGPQQNIAPNVQINSTQDVLQFIEESHPVPEFSVWNALRIHNEKQYEDRQKAKRNKKGIN